MKLKRIAGFAVALAIGGVIITSRSHATHQNSNVYQQMNSSERAVFISAQARRIAKEMSGREYKFTPAFEAASSSERVAHVLLP